MIIVLTNTGSYPRIGDKLEDQLLRKTIAAFDRGEVTVDKIARAEDEVVKGAIEDQIDAGLDLVTDGQIRFYDPISHIAGKLEGVRIGGLLRFFDTNFYVRQPIIEGKVKWKGSILKPEYLYAQSISSKPVKPVITGPYTLAAHSMGKFDFEKLVLEYTDAIVKEVEELAAAGASVIQIDEPSILKKGADYNLFSESIKKIVKVKGRAKLALYTYFGDVVQIYDKLQELPVDIIGIDFTYNKGLTGIIENLGSKKVLGLGLIDGRNTKLEKPEEILKILERIAPKLTADHFHFNPSCGLEYLPKDRARDKLKLLVDIKKMFGGNK